MLLSPVVARSSKEKIQKSTTPPPSSTAQIFTGMPILKPGDMEPLPGEYNADNIPRHFSPAAKELIKKLLAQKVYHHVEMTSPKNSWANKVEPYHLSFHSRHPTLSTIDNKTTVYCDIMTNIDSSGGVNYQIRDFQNVLHYLDSSKITYANLRLIHQNIIAPHLEAIKDKSTQSPPFLLNKRNSI